MDPTGCAPDIFSDHAFKLTGNCDTSAGFVISVFVLILLGRFLGVIQRLRVFQSRRSKRGVEDGTSKRSSRKVRTQLPVGAMIDLSSAVSYLITFVLIGLNIANASNGIALSLYSISFLPFAIGYSLFLFRMVRLGGKLVPFIKQNSDKHLYLSSFSNVGRLLGILQLLSLLVSSLVLIIFAPIFPERDHVFGQVGFAFKGGFILLCGCGLVYQTQRVINVIHQVTREAAVLRLENNNTNDQQENKRKKDGVHSALSKLKFNQFLIVTIAFPLCLLFFCLAGDAMPWDWYYVILITIGGETLGSLAVVFSGRRKKRETTTMATSPGDSSLKSNKQQVALQQQQVVTVKISSIVADVPSSVV